MIGKVIATLLKENTALIALVPEVNIYPYVINENTQLPAIIYTVDNLDTVYDKDGWCQDDWRFSVISFSDNYSTLQNIVEQIRLSLELKRGTDEGIDYKQIYLTGQSEGYNISEDVFMNKLTFEFLTYKQ
jgi:hypothetical protein